MADNYFDLDRLADELGVEVTLDSYSADEDPKKRYIWKRSELPVAVNTAKAAAADGKELCFTGGAMPWLLGAVTAYLAPVLTGFKIDAEEGEVFHLPMGEPTDAGEVKFSVEERKDKVYVVYECDDPAKARCTVPKLRRDGSE